MAGLLSVVHPSDLLHPERVARGESGSNTLFE